MSVAAGDDPGRMLVTLLLALVVAAIGAGFGVLMTLAIVHLLRGQAKDRSKSASDQFAADADRLHRMLHAAEKDPPG